MVPGVGAYAACMAGIERVGGADVVRERVAAGAPVLGICVGMQVLFTGGDEHGVHTDGIGVLDGLVTRLDAPVLPHMGWNTVAPPDGSALFRGVEDERFYFVHSYAARTAPGAVTWAEHGERIRRRRRGRRAGRDAVPPGEVGRRRRAAAAQLARHARPEAPARPVRRARPPRTVVR